MLGRSKAWVGERASEIVEDFGDVCGQESKHKALCYPTAPHGQGDLFLQRADGDNERAHEACRNGRGMDEVENSYGQGRRLWRFHGDVGGIGEIPGGNGGR